MSTNLLSNDDAVGFGGVVREFLWNWENHSLRVVYETLGQGSPLLLLPAFSSVSTRAEMGEFARLLAPHYQVFAVDWPGFGESSRLGLDYRPELYQQFLADFVQSVFHTAITVIAAGHAASYVLQLAVNQPYILHKIVLVAPTWRGPLPTMGANPRIAGMVRELVRSPIVGQVLYKLNTLPSFLNFMYRRHVFVDTTRLTPNFMEKKWQTTQQPGARFASAAFVTGNIDAVHEQSEFLALLRRCVAANSQTSLPLPVMVVIGESSPPKSLQEMQAIAAVPGVQSVTLPGSLGMHEEYPAAILAAIQDFLF